MAPVAASGGLPLEGVLPADGEEAKQIVARAKTGQAAIDTVEAETQRIAPPMLYDLTELQRHANRLYGFSAQRTLDLAQTRYKLGLSSIVELSQAQLQQTDAQIGNTNARYAYLSTLSELNFQAGK